MDNILISIGETLGEPVVNGTRFTRDIKLRWINRCVVDMSLVLPDDLFNSMFKTELKTLAIGGYEYTLDETDLDYLVSVLYDITGVGDAYKIASRISSIELQQIIQNYEASSLDLDQESNYCSNEYPKYALIDGSASDLTTNPASRFFKLSFLPHPDSSVYPLIKLIYMSLPQQITYQDDSWTSDNSIGLATHQACVNAIINYCIHIGKQDDNDLQSANYYHSKYMLDIRKLKSKYSGKFRKASLRVMATPRVL